MCDRSEMKIVVKTEMNYYSPIASLIYGVFSFHAQKVSLIQKNLDDFYKKKNEYIILNKKIAECIHIHNHWEFIHLRRVFNYMLAEENSNFLCIYYISLMYYSFLDQITVSHFAFAIFIIDFMYLYTNICISCLSKKKKITQHEQ